MGEKKLDKKVQFTELFIQNVEGYEEKSNDIIHTVDKEEMIDKCLDLAGQFAQLHNASATYNVCKNVLSVKSEGVHLTFSVDKDFNIKVNDINTGDVVSLENDYATDGTGLIEALDTAIFKVSEYFIG